MDRRRRIVVDEDTLGRPAGHTVGIRRVTAFVRVCCSGHVADSQGWNRRAPIFILLFLALSQSFRRELPQVGLQSIPFLCRFNSVQSRTLHPAFTNDRIIVCDLSDVSDPERFRATSVTTCRKWKSRKNLHPSTAPECPAVAIGAEVNFRTSLPCCLNRSCATNSEHLNARPSSRPPASRKTNTLPELPVFLWLSHCPSVKYLMGMPRIELDMPFGLYPRAQ